MHIDGVAQTLCNLAEQPPVDPSLTAGNEPWYQTSLRVIDFLTSIGHIGHIGTAQALRLLVNVLSPFFADCWPVTRDVLARRPDLRRELVQQLVQQPMEGASAAARALPVKCGPKGHALRNEPQSKAFSAKWVPTPNSLIAAADCASNPEVTPVKTAVLTTLLRTSHAMVVGALDLSSPTQRAMTACTASTSTSCCISAAWSSRARKKN